MNRSLPTPPNVPANYPPVPPIPPIPPSRPAEPKKRRRRRAGLWISLVVILALSWFGYKAVSFYLMPHRATRQIYLVPSDAVFIIQCNQPVDNWDAFSQSAPWQTLSRTVWFADFAKTAYTVDSVLNANRTLMSLVGQRDLMISIHKTRASAWDMLYILDLQKVAEVEAVRSVFALMDFDVTQRPFEGIDIIELTDRKTRTILYTAFVDNHYIASYAPSLVEASISNRYRPSIGVDPYFVEADRQVASRGICRLFVNYAHLPAFMAIYMNKNADNYFPDFSRALTYAGLSFDVSDSRMTLDGYTFLNDTVTDPYTAAYLQSGSQSVQAYHIMPARTAFYTHIGIDDPVAFVGELEKTLAATPDLQQTFNATCKQIESMFDISLADDFLGWMSGEFALVEMEPGPIGYEPEMLLAVRARDIELAKQKMALIERQVRRRTPLYIKSEPYKGYPVNYVEMKGFFALFFGKMLDRFEKPYYTYINDYVVFSNRPAAILSFIEDYENKQLLAGDDGFRRIVDGMDNNEATYFVYTDTRKFMPLLKPTMKPDTRANFDAHQTAVYSFPRIAFRIADEKKHIAMQAIFDHLPYSPPVADPADDEPADDSPAVDELDELKRFYVETFQGNVYREFYPDGKALKSECEVRNGRRHGKYREYYEDGNLRVRGKYAKGEPAGTWKYYTPDGELEEKVKME